MDKSNFVALLQRIAADGIGVHERVYMTDGNKPLLDQNGEQVVNDVVQCGDGRLYIERDGNEPDSEQDVVDLLRSIEKFLPEIIAAFADAIAPGEG